jgi:hypothetical protein
MKYKANGIQLALCVFTGIVGYTINNESYLWAILNGLFWEITWLKWLICRDVTIPLIKQAFEFMN